MMYQKEMLQVKDKVLSKHPKYPAFAKFLKRTSRKRLRDTSVISYIKQLEAMRTARNCDDCNRDLTEDERDSLRNQEARNKRPLRKNCNLDDCDRFLYGLDLDDPDIMSVIDVLIDKELTVQSINVRRIVLRRWMKFLKRDLTDDEREALKNQKGPNKTPLRKRDMITEAGLQELFSHVNDPAKRAFYAVLWDLGLRPSEGTNLDVGQVIQDEYGFKFLLDTDPKKVKNTWGLRSIYMVEPISIMHFQGWWAMHPLRSNPKAPLFLNQWGERLTPHNAFQLLRRVRKKINESREREKDGEKIEVLNLYLFRKSMATRWISLGRDERLLRYRMGHTRDSKMIERHYLAMDQKDFDDGHLALLGKKREEADKEKAPDSAPCPHCGQMNRVGRSDDFAWQTCFRCGTALTPEEGLRRQKLVTSGVILQQVLDDPAAAMFDEYIAVFGETVEKLLQPIVNKMVTRAIEKRES